jgi:hypothetical protein
MDSSKGSTTKFFLLNPTKEKIIISLFDSLVMILISLTIPSLGFQSVFLSKELSGQIFYIVSNLIFSSVVYYPFACGLVYIYKIIAGKEKIKGQNLVIALLFIIIFNIVTFSIITTKIINNNQTNSPSTNSVVDSKTKKKLCGLQIVAVTAPSAKNAGLVVGEVINTVNNYPVDTMDALNHALTNKKTNDIVIVITNANTYNVTLFANPQNPQQVLMGIKVNPTECGK